MSEDILEDDISRILYESDSVSSGDSIVSRIIPYVVKCGTFAVGLLAIALGILYKKQDKLLYFPEIGGIPRRPGSNPRRYRSPSEHKLPFESHMIMTSDRVKIHSWLLLHPNSKKDQLPTIIFFHGNAGNIGLRLPNAYQMYHLLNANILMVEYRGYGDSESKSEPSERGLKRDAEASLRFLLTHPSVDPTRLFLFGRSLGGAVAFHLASHAEKNGIPLAGLIVENTFLSIGRMVDVLMPYLAPLKMLILRIGWDSGVIADGLRMPVLYLSGGADQLVPPEQMMELYRKSGKSSVCARMYVVKDGTHNETWLQGGTAYWEKIKGFINEAMSMSRNNSFYGSASISDSDLNKDGSHMDVGLGTEAENSAKSSIPIMPNNIIGMAREGMSSKKKEH